MGLNTGGYSRFQVTGMIEWDRNQNPRKIPGPNYQVLRISRKGYITGFIKQMQCNALNIKTTT